MELYAQALMIAIPTFSVLIFIEFFIGLKMGRKTIRSMDTISSLSSGMTNTLKDVLGLTVIIISYDFLVGHLALFDIKTTWLLYVLAFIGKDFAGYWTHRFEHVINIFWNRHIIHHSSEEFNLSCALRQTVSTFFALFTFLYIPMAIIGIPTKVIALVAPIHLFAQFWYHTTLIKKMGFLEYIIVTPSHHRVHHAINDIYLDKNFAQIFIIWDKLFGTFQEELEEEPPVYGVKKPVRTWNPFLINFQHMWLVAKDSFRTKNIWDKIRIWFMPTGWRPEDVREKHPIEIITDPHSMEKYDTPSTPFFTAWHWGQLLINLSLLFYMLSVIVEFSFDHILMYALFLSINVFSYTTLMDRNPYAGLTELIKFGYGLFLIYFMGGWYGLDQLIPYGSFIMAGYLILSLVITLYYVFADLKTEKDGGMQLA